MSAAAATARKAPVQVGLEAYEDPQKVRDAEGRAWHRQVDGAWTDTVNPARAGAAYGSRDALEKERGPVIEVARRVPPTTLPRLEWGERLSEERLEAVAIPVRGDWRRGLCEKAATVAELADLVAALIASPEAVQEAPADFQGERWKAFVGEVVDLLCRHFGGERASGVYWAPGAESWCVRVRPSPAAETAPRGDGGIWAPVDPEVVWGQGPPRPGDVLVAVQDGPRGVERGALGLIRGATSDGTVLVSWGVTRDTEVVWFSVGGLDTVSVPAGVDIDGVPGEEVLPTGRRAWLPFRVGEDDTRDQDVGVYVWKAKAPAEPRAGSEEKTDGDTTARDRGPEDPPANGNRGEGGG